MVDGLKEVLDIDIKMDTKAFKEWLKRGMKVFMRMKLPLQFIRSEISVYQPIVLLCFQRGHRLSY
jgi:hypothetical protein